MELSDRMEALRGQYQDSGQGAPRHVVVSYLRSSLLDRYPAYRISMYDEEFLYSDRECAVAWEITELAAPLYRIMGGVEKEFARQTRVGAYHMDEILLTYGDRLHQWLIPHMPHIFKRHLADTGWMDFYRRNCMRLSAGEYRSQNIRIFEWGNRWNIWNTFISPGTDGTGTRLISRIFI